jgi:hypothetical protein
VHAQDLSQRVMRSRARSFMASTTSLSISASRAEVGSSNSRAMRVRWLAALAFVAGLCRELRNPRSLVPDEGVDKGRLRRLADRKRHRQGPGPSGADGR